MLDSGGFKLLMSRNVHYDVERAIHFFRGAAADLTVTLDYPLSGLASYKENRRRWRKTVANLDRIRNALPGIALMPVIHGLTLRQIENACQTVERTLGDPIVLGLGGLVPLLTARYARRPFRYERFDKTSGTGGTFIADALTLVRSYFPRSFTHVFGVGSTTTALVVLSLGADSVDSVSWRAKAAYGKIHLPGTSDRYLRRNRNGRDDHPSLDKAERELLRMCPCPVCSEFSCFRRHVSYLENSFEGRALHNAWVLLREISAFRTAIRRGKDTSLVKERLRNSHRLWPVIGKV
jgi:7-cyano-7-deazaguanine tRNA-ribosyltransferase